MRRDMRGSITRRDVHLVIEEVDLEVIPSTPSHHGVEFHHTTEPALLGCVVRQESVGVIHHHGGETKALAP